MKLLVNLAGAVVLFFAASVALAADDVYTGFLSEKALSGYDAVAYFTEGKPVKGNKKFQFRYKDADWYFSSAENKEKFAEKPEAYAPQYGGYCAWAVGANGAKAPGDPKYWRIVNNKLYLNYNKDVQQKWLKDIPGFIKLADEKWPTL